MRRETLKFYDGNKYIIDNNKILNEGLVGLSLYDGDPNREMNFDLEEASHIIRELIALDQTDNYELTIDFLDNEHGERAKKAYSLIKTGKHNGSITPIVISSCGKIIRIDIIYDHIKCEPTEECPCITEKRIGYTFDKLKDLFKYINDDMEALKLCAEHRNHIEIVNDGGQSWTQRKDGIEEDDIIYDFKEDFGNRDGIYNLFKMLNINAKSV